MIESKLKPKLKILLLYAGKPPKFGFYNNGSFEFYPVSLDESIPPRIKFDMAAIYFKKFNIKAAKKYLMDRNLSDIPIFGIFEKISFSNCCRLIKNIFTDVRIIKKPALKIYRALSYWSNKYYENSLGELRKKRLRFFRSKLKTNSGWLKRDMIQVQTQLMRIQHVVDSMEMWQGGGRLDRELKIANGIQSSLLPKSLPKFRGFEFDAVCIPAKEVGGDFFDFFRIGEDRLGFVIGDVATRGIPAALLMTAIRGMWRALMVDAISSRYVVSQINSLLCHDLENMWGLYVSLFCAIIDKKNKKLFFTNAGHCCPALYRSSSKEVLELTEGGSVLGINKNAIYEEGEIELKRSDIVVCYTDGITECHHDPDLLFGKQKLYEIVKKNSKHSVKYIREKIFSEVDDFLGISDFKDDKAMFLFKCHN